MYATEVEMFEAKLSGRIKSRSGNKVQLNYQHQQRKLIHINCYHCQLKLFNAYGLLYFWRGMHGNSNKGL